MDPPNDHATLRLPDGSVKTYETCVEREAREVKEGKRAPRWWGQERGAFGSGVPGAMAGSGLPEAMAGFIKRRHALFEPNSCVDDYISMLSHVAKQFETVASKMLTGFMWKIRRRGFGRRRKHKKRLRG